MLAWPCHQNRSTSPITVSRNATSTINCKVPAQVARTHSTWVRARQRSTTRFNRSSSRASAPNDFTTGLQVTASASAAPSLLSQAFDRRAAGVT